MLIYFPQMHEELVEEKVEGALIFDPGIDRDETGDVPVYRPENLPVEPQTCRRMVDDFISYGESLGAMFKFIANPSPMTKISSVKEPAPSRMSWLHVFRLMLLTKAMKKHAFRTRWFWLFVTPTKKKYRTWIP